MYKHPKNNSGCNLLVFGALQPKPIIYKVSYQPSIAAYGLAIRVTGAADSATGTTVINNSLGDNRADYIVSQLQKRGVGTSFITKINNVSSI